MARHAVVKIKLRAVIGGINFDDVIQYTASWAVNSIPVASLLVAVGRNVKNQQLAKIHEAKKTLTSESKVEVFLTTTVSDFDQAVAGVPNGQEIKIFEGKLVGTGWQRTSSGAHFTLHVLHWLGDLNNSSSASASLHPGSPGDLTYPAVFPAIGLRDVDPQTSPIPAWVPGLSKSSVNEGSFADIWGNILLPWMRTIASDDPFDKGLQAPGVKGNPDTLAALARMVPNADGKPLNLKLKDASGVVLADSMRAALVNEIGSNWVNTTLWGKLIGEWAPAYWFSVIPRVTDALVVPFTGGLQGQPWSVIGDEDYVSADLNSQLQQVLRAVGIIYPVMSATSFDLNLGLPQTARSGLLGMYRPDGVETGMVLLKDAPKWLSNSAVSHMLSFFAEGIDQTTIGTGMDEIGVGGGRNPAANFDDNNTRFNSIASAYAHQWYVLESLKGRTGEIAGKLRFDISPGSNVLIVAGGSRNVPQAQEITEDIFATVTQVSYVINAEGQKAGTAFSLAHIRSQKENTEPGTSIDVPPLYTEAWPGAKLVTDAPGPEQLEP